MILIIIDRFICVETDAYTFILASTSLPISIMGQGGRSGTSSGRFEIRVGVFCGIEGGRCLMRDMIMRVNVCGD